MMDLITGLVSRYYHEPYASLMNGILLGRPLFVTDTFYNQLKEVGLIHIVVLSGMNITMLSAIVLTALIPILGRTIATGITIVIIIVFIGFVGAEAPVVRAGIMGVLALIAILFGRKTLTLWLLFLSAGIMLLVNPSWLTSISFQLSFGATLGIILFGTAENQQNDNSGKVSTFIRYFHEELRVSLAAQVFTLPMIFWYFRQISIVAPLTNIAVAWTITPVMIIGMVSIAVGTISEQAGFILSWLAIPLLSWIVFVVEKSATIPFAYIQL